MGCSVCGAGCEPMQERCARCGSDPFGGVGERLGPLSVRQFWRKMGWRLAVAIPLLVWIFWDGASSPFPFVNLPLWARAGLEAMLTLAVITVLYQLWLTWKALQGALVLTPAEAWLYQRRGGRVYFERMSWQECFPTEPPRGWRVLEALSTLVHLFTHIGLQGLTILLPDQVYELRLRSRVDARRVWQLALVGAQYQPHVALSRIACYALPYWLQSGAVRIELGYEPSPERPFLALDLRTRTLRAYAFREVRLEEGSMRWEIRRESLNPDGSRVESDHSLDADAAHAERALRKQVEVYELPAFAMPYQGYWLRADWGIIKRIESRRAASETAVLPTLTPQHPEQK
ncbi:MAG: hypothetical protein NZ556_05250 [Fimbriimonadales bacterium]|nr:hypothetical protein [Fimbriimonadales bacterium]